MKAGLFLSIDTLVSSITYNIQALKKDAATEATCLVFSLTCSDKIRNEVSSTHGFLPKPRCEDSLLSLLNFILLKDSSCLSDLFHQY